MFEKEAEKYIKENNLEWELECHRTSPIGEVEQAYLKGAEFGYNKANEWHCVKDGDLPKRVDDYITNIGVLTYDDYGNGVHKWHTPYCEACDYADEVGDDEVIAWCEIPTYKEEQKYDKT